MTALKLTPDMIEDILHRMEKGKTTIADANAIRATILSLRAAVDDDAVIEDDVIIAAMTDEELVQATIDMAGTWTHLDDEVIEDGFGNAWRSKCPECGGRMEIVRPGKVQCENEWKHDGVIVIPPPDENLSHD